MRKSHHFLKKNNFSSISVLAKFKFTTTYVAEIILSTRILTYFSLWFNNFFYFSSVSTVPIRRCELLFQK